MGYQANQAWSVFFTEITHFFGRSWRMPFPEIGFQKKEASDSIPFDYLKKQQTCWLYPPNFLIVAPRMATRSPSCVDVSILSQSRYPETKDWVKKNQKCPSNKINIIFQTDYFGGSPSFGEFSTFTAKTHTRRTMDSRQHSPPALQNWSCLR